MGKGGKNKKLLEKVPEPEPQPEPQQEEQQQEEEIEDSVDDLLDEDEDEDDQLLKKIQDEIIGSDEAVKLSWAAIHALKEQERKMNEEMDEQMRKIQQKFDKLKEPIFHQIAKAASGQTVNKQLYKNHQLTKSLNCDKITPLKIPGFWVGVFQSIGLFISQLDKEMFEKCTRLSVESEKDEAKDEQKISVELEFQENEYFKNKVLKFSVYRKETTVQVPEISRIQFKKPQNQESIISEIFDPNHNTFKLYEYASDFLRAYNQSVFFYFFESKLEDDELAALEEGQEGEDNGEDDDDDEDQDDDDEDQEIGKPVKRRKPNAQKGPVQKPECKQQ